MGLETATTISGLQSTNPTLLDPLSQGDDHLRLIKSVLKSQFPGVGGQGFASVITATEAQLNFVTGATSNIQTQLNTHTTNIATALAVIPAGTRMVFAQAAAPTGWTKVTTWANHMLRVVSGTGGGSFTGDSPILNSKVVSHTHTSAATTATESALHSHTITIDAVAAHTHTYTSTDTTSQQAQSLGGGIAVGKTTSTSSSGGGHTHTGSTGTESAAHAHYLSGTTDVPTGTSTWTPSYLDTIICSKN
jgi:hypothetical protein